MSSRHRLVPVAALAAALLALAGCNRYTSQAPQGGAVALHVRNNAFLDVNVFSLPTTGIDTRIRLGTVTGHSSLELTVPSTALRPGGILVLYLHAIGSNSDWVSPAVLVDPTQAACLDIYANPDGDLSRSSLYTTIVAAAGDRAASTAVAPVTAAVRQDVADCMW